MNNFISGTGGAMRALAFMLLYGAGGGASGQSDGPWIAPARAAAVKNRVLATPEAKAEGQKLFTSMCAVCHGATGKGNGEASVALTPKPADFLSIKVQNESDGAIFWKMTEGRPPMASYKTLLTDDQRWKLVLFIRSLEEKAKKP